MNIFKFIKKNNNMKRENEELKNKILEAKKELSITKRLATGTKYKNEQMYFRKMAEQIEKIEDIFEIEEFEND